MIDFVRINQIAGGQSSGWKQDGMGCFSRRRNRCQRGRGPPERQCDLSDVDGGSERQKRTEKQEQEKHQRVGFCLSQNRQQNLRGVHGLSFDNTNFLNSPGFRSLEIVLHFHGFNNRHALTFFDRIAFRDE